MTRFLPHGQRNSPTARWRLKYFPPDAGRRQKLLEQQLQQAQKELNLNIRILSRRKFLRLVRVIQKF